MNGEIKMKEWMNKFGWQENPFNFKIYPDLLVGYKDEIEQVRDAISAGNKFSVITGRTGAGKTNLLKWLASQYTDSREVFYMPKPPKNNEDLLDYLKKEVLKPGIISQMFNSFSLYNLHEELDKKFDRPALLIIDEGHEASTDVLRWVRTAIDHVENLSVVAAGLPEFEERLKEDINTLHSRATTAIDLESLNRDESIKLIRKRIERAGGSSLDPLTTEAAVEIYNHTNGFPREVIRACNRCVVHAAREDLSIIDPDDVSEILEEEEIETEDEEESGAKNTDLDNLNLTPKQEKVLEVLKEEGQSSSGEIVDTTGFEDYESRSHAVRSVNNILKRLMENDVVDREREGRSYSYFIK
ncbi:MAG: AAA family ATPase [Candidatus Nanohaloarchaea archaeon]|nr:AAA family ATPase [Candidatus Nanohaloarchaea archaeon]